jgi:hypothetical protein
MRLATVRYQMVVLLDSDVSLFETALGNVQRGEAGMAASKRLGAFHRHAAKDRLFEVYATVEGMLRLTECPDRHAAATLLRGVDAGRTFAANRCAYSNTRSAHDRQPDTRMPAVTVRMSTEEIDSFLAKGVRFSGRFRLAEMSTRQWRA